MSSGSRFRNFAKKESMKRAFQDMLHELGEVNPTHAYYNDSRTSKDNEDPSWSTSFKTRRTQKTSSALEETFNTSTRCRNDTPEIAGRSKDGSGPESIASVLVRLVQCQKDQTRTTTVMWCQKDQTKTTTTCGVRRTRLANIEEVHVQLFPRCYKATTTILLSLGGEGATTASEGVKAEPHSYFQLRSGGATSEGAEAHQTILIFKAHLPSPSGPLFMKYLVNISKRRAFWSLNEDILKITILKTNMMYPSRKIRRIRVCTHQRPQRNKAQYAVSREDQYAVLEMWNKYNILEYIKRGPYSKKSLIRRIQSLDMSYRTDFQTL
ncbi:hypothetical protein Tco_1127150 [Tanacetum coccineum]